MYEYCYSNLGAIYAKGLCTLYGPVKSPCTVTESVSFPCKIIICLQIVRSFIEYNYCKNCSFLL